MKKTLAAALALTIAAPAIGQRQYTMVGHGASTCGQWTSDKASNSIGRTSDRAWLAGFITGFNLYAPGASGNVSKGVDSAGIAAWMDNYCQAHPLDPIAAAAEALVVDLRRRR